MRCSDETLYIGHTDDVVSREHVHNERRGGRYMALRRPVRLVYSEHHDPIAAAVVREKQLKRVALTYSLIVLTTEQERIAEESM